MYFQAPAGALSSRHRRILHRVRPQHFAAALVGFTCQDYGEGLVIFVNSDYFGIFADPSHQPEWRNGRRDGLKIHCPLKMCGFESRLGHEQGKNRSNFFDYSRVANGFSFSDVLPALLAPAGRYYVDPSPNPFPRGRDLVGLRPPMVLVRRLRGRCSRGQKLAEIVPPGRFRVPLGQKSAKKCPAIPLHPKGRRGGLSYPEKS